MSGADRAPGGGLGRAPLLRGRHIAAALASGAAGLALLALLAGAAELRFNTTASLPTGLYRLRAVPPDPGLGGSREPLLGAPGRQLEPPQSPQPLRSSQPSLPPLPSQAPRSPQAPHSSQPPQSSQPWQPPQAPRIGDLVLVCPPRPAARLARARGYLAAGSCPGGSRALGKVLVAAAGDLVETSAGGLAVNGLPIPSSHPLARDPAGRPLPQPPYQRRRLAPGELWVWSPHRLSYDSRYFGPVSRAGLRGVLVPLWVGSPAPCFRALPAFSGQALPAGSRAGAGRGLPPEVRSR